MPSIARGTEGSNPSPSSGESRANANLIGERDWYFCLGGTLRIETRAPRAEERLAAGGRYAIPPKTVHQISNGGDGEDCRFLLLQGVGVYDFNKIQD